MPVPATTPTRAGSHAGAGRPAVAEGRAHGVAGGGHAELGGAVDAAGLLEAEAGLGVEPA